MAYAQGDPILRDHYNTFATGSATGAANHAVANINSVWGVGNGDKGYGQSTVLTAVAAGDIITAAQWSTLLARLNTVLTHQAGAGSGITSPVTGDIITYLSTLQTNVTNAYNNRANYSISGATTTTNYSATWNTATPTTFQQARTITFGSADAARYFFNSGGRITIGFSTTNAADTTKEQDWNTLLATNLGTLTFGWASSTRSGTGGTVSINGLGIGFWDLLSTDQTIIRLASSTSAYTSNYVEVLAKISGTAGSNGGLGTTITFTINYNDGVTDNFNDAINFSITTAIGVIVPETTYLTDTWGTVTPAATVN